MGFGFFRRRVRDRRPECGTWRVGDLAVCVADDWRPATAEDPKVGDVVRVALVGEAVLGGQRWTFLGLVGKRSSFGWSANGFRKPVIDDAGADETVEQLIKQARPARIPERVPA